MAVVVGCKFSSLILPQGDQNEEVVAVTNQAVVTPSVQQEAPPAASPITQVVNPVTPTPALPSTSTNAGSATVVAAAAVEAMPSQQQQQQQQQHTTGVALGKRARDEDRQVSFYCYFSAYHCPNWLINLTMV